MSRAARCPAGSRSSVGRAPRSRANAARGGGLRRRSDPGRAGRCGPACPCGPGEELGAARRDSSRQLGWDAAHEREARVGSEPIPREGVTRQSMTRPSVQLALWHRDRARWCGGDGIQPVAVRAEAARPTAKRSPAPSSPSRWCWCRAARSRSSGKVVDVAPFYIGRTEVTWDMYDVFALGLDTPAPAGGRRRDRAAVAALRRARLRLGTRRVSGDQRDARGGRGLLRVAVRRRPESGIVCRPRPSGCTPRSARDRRRRTDADAPRRDRLAPRQRRRPHARGRHESARTRSGCSICSAMPPSGSRRPTARSCCAAARSAMPPRRSGPASRAVQDESWNERDPQLPKSRWWLSDGPFVGFRIVRVDECETATASDRPSSPIPFRAARSSRPRRRDRGVCRARRRARRRLRRHPRRPHRLRRPRHRRRARLPARLRGRRARRARRSRARSAASVPRRAGQGRRRATPRSPRKIKVTDERCFTGFDAYQKVLATDIDLVILATPPGFRPDAPRRGGRGRQAHLRGEAGRGRLRRASARCSRRYEAREEEGPRRSAPARSAGTRPSTSRRSSASTTARSATSSSGQVYWNQGGLWNRDGSPSGPTPSGRSATGSTSPGSPAITSSSSTCTTSTSPTGCCGAHPVKAIGVGGRQWRTDPKYGHIYDHFAIDYEYPNGARVHEHVPPDRRHARPRRRALHRHARARRMRTTAEIIGRERVDVARRREARQPVRAGAHRSGREHPRRQAAQRAASRSPRARSPRSWAARRRTPARRSTWDEVLNADAGPDAAAGRVRPADGAAGPDARHDQARAARGTRLSMRPMTGADFVQSSAADRRGARRSRCRAVLPARRELPRQARSPRKFKLELCAALRHVPAARRRRISSRSSSSWRPKASPRSRTTACAAARSTTRSGSARRSTRLEHAHGRLRRAHHRLERADAHHRPTPRSATTFLKEVRESVDVAKRVNAKWMTVVPGHVDRRPHIDYQTANVVETLKRACGDPRAARPGDGARAAQHAAQPSRACS